MPGRARRSSKIAEQAADKTLENEAAVATEGEPPAQDRSGLWPGRGAISWSSPRGGESKTSPWPSARCSACGARSVCHSRVSGGPVRDSLAGSRSGSTRLAMTSFRNSSGKSRWGWYCHSPCGGRPGSGNAGPRGRSAGRPWPRPRYASHNWSVARLSARRALLLFLRGHERLVQVRLSARLADCDYHQQQGHGRQAGVTPGPAPGTFLAGADGLCTNWLAGRRSTQVVGQIRGAGVAAPGSFPQAFQADRLQVARHLRLQPRGGTGSPAAHLLQRVQRPSPPGTAAGRSAARTGWPPGRRRRPPGRPALPCPPPAPGPCSWACPGSRPVWRLARPSSSRLARPKSVILGVPSARPAGRWPASGRGGRCRAGGRSGRPAPASRPAAAASAAAAACRPASRPGCRPRRTPARRGLAVVLADLVDLHDVGVLQPGHGLGLHPEARQSSGGRAAPRGSSSARRPGSAACRAL